MLPPSFAHAVPLALQCLLPKVTSFDSKSFQETPMTTSAVAIEQATTTLKARFGEVRDRTASICSALSPEDLVVQSMPDASPAKCTWHIQVGFLKPSS